CVFLGGRCSFFGFFFSKPAGINCCGLCVLVVYIQPVCVFGVLFFKVYVWFVGMTFYGGGTIFTDVMSFGV
ncbi:hypothetical protein ACTHSI_27345, partial [Neisseria sp. P0001.S004]